MDCSKFSEMLENYETLTDIEKELLEDHAAVCEKCRNELIFFKSINETLHTLPKITAPESLLSDINKRIDDTTEKKHERNKLLLHIRKYSYRYSAAAACIALFAIVGVRNSNLVNRMIYRDDGVISEVAEHEVSPNPTGLPKSTSAPITTSAPTEKPVDNTKSKATAKASSTPKTAKSTLLPTSKPTVNHSQATTSIITPKPKSNANTANRTTSVTATSKPYVSAVPEVRQTQIPQPTSTPINTPETQTATPEDYKPIQNEESNTAYVFEQTYRLPKDEQNIVENNSQNDYENNSSASPEEWAVVTATLTVSSEDEERVRELIDIYTSDQIGEQYKIDADRMQYMLDVFTQEGIGFNQSARQSAKSTDGDLMLTLIIS